MNKETPKNWEKVKLKKYIEIVRGVNYKSNESYDYKNENTTGILRANNISNNGTLNFEKIIYVDNKNIKNEQIIKKGDIVIAMSSGSKDLVGKAAQAKHDLNFAFGAFCGVVRPKNINSDFLGFYFLTDYYRNKISELSTGININNLRKEYIENLDIMVPLNPKEQEEIVQVLDTMNDIIRLREECISHAQDLIPALFQEMFGNPLTNDKNLPIVRIDTVTKVVSGGTPSTQNPEYWDGDIIWLTPKDLSGYNSMYISKGERNITDLGYKKSSAQMMPKGSVLFTSRAPIGYVAIADTDLCTNQGFKSFIPAEAIKSEYLYQLLKMSKEKIINMSSGATFKEISGSRIKELKIPLAPIELQEQFAIKVREINSYIEEQQEELKNAKQMFQSLIHHAFTGEITRRAYGND